MNIEKLQNKASRIKFHLINAVGGEDYQVITFSIINIKDI